MRLTQFFQTIHGPARYSGEATPMPGCPDLVVSHAVYRMEGSGLGRRANAERLRQLRELGYSAVICTVACTNSRQISIMKGNDWTRMGSFVNKRTGHGVEVFLYQL